MKFYKEYYDKDYRNRIHKYYNDKISSDTMRYQKKYGFELNPQKGHETWNVEADAFKHAYGSALMSLEKDGLYSMLAGWQHEKATPNNPNGENKMDTHNNKIGREIANDIRNQYGKKWDTMSREQKENIISEKVWNSMQNGRVILDPSGRTKLKNSSDEMQHIKSSPKPAWDKYGNLTGLAADIGAEVNGDNVNNNTLPWNNKPRNIMFNKQAIGHEGNKAIRNNLDIFGQYNPNNTDNGKLDNGLSDEFKTNTFDVLKKDSPYIDKTNTIDNFDMNKNSILPTKTNNSFTDLIKKSSMLNNNMSIDNQDLIAKNSTLGGIDNSFINKVKGKRFQDLTDEERLKALWHFVG